MKSNADHQREFDSLTSATIETKRGLIRDLLEQCTDAQIGMFRRMYGSIDAIPEDKMRWAYSQCARTVDTNKLRVEGGG